MTYPVTEASAQHVIERTTFRVYDGPPHHGKSRVMHMTALLDSSRQSVWHPRWLTLTNCPTTEQSAHRGAR